MTATNTLRAMLDERGVEWDELVGHPVVVGTEWHDRDGYPCTALEHADDVPDGMLSVQANLTPAQAIEATLSGDLRAENAELRKERDALDRLTDVLNETNDGLLAENEQLRELVRHMHDCIDSYGKATGDFGCNSCPRNNDTGECDFDARMRELGVEV